MTFAKHFQTTQRNEGARPAGQEGEIVAPATAPSIAFARAITYLGIPGSLPGAKGQVGWPAGVEFPWICNREISAMASTIRPVICQITGNLHLLLSMRSARQCADCQQKVESCCEESAGMARRG
jgi:hypothetical protein